MGALRPKHETFSEVFYGCPAGSRLFVDDSTVKRGETFQPLSNHAMAAVLVTLGISSSECIAHMVGYWGYLGLKITVSEDGFTSKSVRRTVI